MDSTAVIHKFAENIHYLNNIGERISLYIEARESAGLIYQHNTDCYIYFVIEYRQYQIDILWYGMNDEIMHNLELRGSYNTNFHAMHIEDEFLHIDDGNVKLVICVER